MIMCDDLKSVLCADPFSKLGLFPIVDKKQGYQLFVWKPNAVKVTVIDLHSGKSLGDMERIDEAGYFIASFPRRKNRFFYTLDITYEASQVREIDPYQFLLPEFEELNDPSRLYNDLGAHLKTVDTGKKKVSGVYFSVYAPNARTVSVIGDFNVWNGTSHPLQSNDDGRWRLFIPEITPGMRYKFEIKSSSGEVLPHKSDPFAFYSEQYPSFSSIVYDHNDYKWNDDAWLSKPVENVYEKSMSIYEVHLGSWRRGPDNQRLSYPQLINELIPYVKEMGFTHIELLPITEYPFDGSWGYQPLGMFSPTSRYGKPEELKAFIDACHQADIAVIIDWVPAHFPSDAHGLALFDGTALYEYEDPKRGWHPDWDSCVYDYGKWYVKDFLISSVMMWLDQFHIDGIRVDAVASMLYLDYSRKEGEWIPNVNGGNVNLEAVEFIKSFNECIYHNYPNAITFAEESTAYTNVSKPTYLGGLGFGFKWNMGWMHDSLEYMKKDTCYRRHHHNELTFSMIYAYHENFVLPLSHDEVVHGKGSLVGKMSGDEWQRAANLRAFHAYMYAHPGKKLNFMGNEFGQVGEWSHETSLDWHVLQYSVHNGQQKLIKELNHLYTDEAALHELDHSEAGFEWLMNNDAENSVIAFVRYAKNRNHMLVVTNFTEKPIDNYRLGAIWSGAYEIVLNTDNTEYHGSGYSAESLLNTENIAWDGHEHSINLRLPPLCTLYLKPVEHTQQRAA